MNNHIATIFEDFDENLPSEFSTQREFQETPKRSEKSPEPTPIEIPTEINFGTCYFGLEYCQTIEVGKGALLESDLQGILYFEDNSQHFVSEQPRVKVYFKPNRLGSQEKYFQVTTREGEVDVTVTAEVESPPQLLHSKTELKIRKIGVYKLPLKCMCTRETTIEFTCNMGLKKSKITF